MYEYNNIHKLKNQTVIAMKNVKEHIVYIYYGDVVIEGIHGMFITNFRIYAAL